MIFIQVYLGIIAAVYTLAWIEDHRARLKALYKAFKNWLDEPLFGRFG